MLDLKQLIYDLTVPRYGLDDNHLADSLRYALEAQKAKEVKAHRVTDTVKQAPNS